MRDREAAKRLIYQAQAAVTSVLVLGDVPPLRALYCPGYPKELLGEVVRDGEKNYMIALRIPKRGYGWYKRRSPKNRAIPPECDVKQLEAVFTLFLPTPFRCVAVRNASENVKIFIDIKEDTHEQLSITEDFNDGSSMLSRCSGCPSRDAPP